MLRFYFTNETIFLYDISQYVAKRLCSLVTFEPEEKKPWKRNCVIDDKRTNRWDEYRFRALCGWHWTVVSIKSTNGLFAAVSEIDFECRIENRFPITLIRFTSPSKSTRM